MNSKTKFTLMVTAMVAVTLLAIVGIMAVFAARQQSFSTSITVVYKSTNVEGTATAQWKLGKYQYGSWGFYGDWNDMVSSSSTGNQKELDLSATGPLSLSPEKSIDLSDESPAVVLKYTFTNTATHPYTLNLTYQPTEETKNINSCYAASPNLIDDWAMANSIEDKFLNTIETTVLGQSTENIYIVLKIDDLGSDSIFNGNFNIQLTGQSSDYQENFVYLYDGTNTVLTGMSNPEATVLDTTNLTNDNPSVTKIGSFAFQKNDNLQTVVLNGIEEVGNYAFENCKSIANLNLGEDLITIGNMAFQYCSSIGNEVIIPNKAKTIGDHAFAYCSSLSDVTIGGDSLNIAPWAFSWNQGTLTNVRFLEGVETIGDYAFYPAGRHTGSANLIIPNSVKNIGVQALPFSGISSISIGSGLSSIGNNGYSALPKSGVKSVIVAADNEKYTSRDEAGNECNVIIEKSTKTLIYGCEQSIIPNSEMVNNIDSVAFMGSSCTSITIPENITIIGPDAFSNCDKLKEIINKSRIPDDEIMNEEIRNQKGIRIIHDESEKGEFSTISGVKYYSYDNNVIALGLEDETMEGSLILQANTTEIVDYAFYYCERITSVTIPESVTTVGENAFCPDRLLEIINKSNVPDDEIIDEWSRNGNGIRIIHEESEKGEFRTINGVKYYSYDNNFVAIGFEDDNMQGVLTFQSNTIFIKAYAFYRCAGIIEIVIPESVTGIGDNAFYGCNDLTSIIIEGQEQLCNNFMSSYSGGLANSLQIGGTIKAKYKINIPPYIHYFTESETQVDGYWVYTKVSE